MNATATRRWVVVAGLGVMLAGAASGAPDVDASAGLDVAAMDPAVRPGDDFHAFATGGGGGPAGAVGVIAARTEVQLAALVQKAAQSAAPAGSDARLVGDYYAAFMDEDGIDARGLHPLDALRTRIASMQDRHEIARYLGETLRADVDPLNGGPEASDNLFGLAIAPDPDAPDRYAPFLLQGGLGMPERKFYVDPEPAMVAIRAGYLRYVATLLRLAGEADADARAERVVDLEQHLAAVQWTGEQARELRSGDNHWRRGDFQKLAPGLDWTLLFEGAGLPYSQHVFVVWQPGAIRGIAALVHTMPVSEWKDYLWVHALEQRVQWLPKAFGDAYFAFRDTLPGAAAPHARWKRALAATDAALGDALGRLYVVKYFAPQDRAAVETLAGEVRDALRQRIARLDGLSAQGRARAEARLAGLQIGAGYPDQWRDYAGLTVARDDAFGNAERASRFEYRYQLARLGNKVDRAEWPVAPQAVRAAYLPARNVLILPAALLQPPLYASGRDPALNYGAVGVLIGREIAGTLEDRDALVEAERLAAQAGTRPAGAGTLAALAGILAALDAWHHAAAAAAVPPAGGYSGDQRFFIASAQAADTPGFDALLRNVDAWYAAFDVRPGQALYLAPAERVRIW